MARGSCPPVRPATLPRAGDSHVGKPARIAKVSFRAAPIPPVTSVGKSRMSKMSEGHGFLT